MALRRDPYTELADRYLSRGQPEPARSSTPAASQTTPEPTSEEIQETRERRSLARASQTERALNLGVSGVQSGLVASRGLARTLAGDEGGQADLQRAVDISERAAAEGPRIQRIEDIDGVGTALEYARNVAVQQLPNVALIAGTGGLAGAARGAVGGLARRAAIRSAGERAAVRQAGEGAVTARAADQAAATVARRLPAGAPASQTAQRLGAAAGGTTLQAGQMAEAALDDTQGGSDRERAAKAVGGAVVTGAVEALPIMALMRRYGLAPAEDAAKAVARGPLLQRIATQAAKQGAQESATELAQTVGELATHKWINDTVSLTDADAFSQYVNAAVGGAVGGAIFGAPAGLRGGGKDPNTRQRITDGLSRGWAKVQDQLGIAPTTETVSTTSETEGGGSIRERFDRRLQEIRNQSYFSAMTADLDADPYDFAVVDGEAILGGAPGAAFVDRARLQSLMEWSGAPQEAVWMAALPEGAPVDRLRRQGSFAAVQKAFTGWDLAKFTPEEKTSLNAYRDALPEQKRVQFDRILATVAEMGERGVLERNEDGSLGEAYVYRPESAGPFAQAAQEGEIQELQRQQATADTAEIDTTQRQRTPEQFSQGILRAARGNVVRGEGSPADAMVMRNEAGQRRRVSMASAIRELRQDPDFRASMNELPAAQKTEAEVAAVIGYLQEQGWQIEPESIQAGARLDAAGSWRLPPAAVDRLRANLGSQQGRAAAANRAMPVQPTERLMDTQEQLDPRMENEQELGAELPQDRGFIERQPILPGQGSPSGVTDTRTIDSGAVDRAAQRQERQPTNTVADNTERLDRMLEAYSGGRPQNAAARREGIRLMRSTLTGRRLEQLNQRVLALAEANVRERRQQADAAAQEFSRLRRQRDAGGAVTGEQLQAAREAVAETRRRLNNAQAARNRERSNIRRPVSATLTQGNALTAVTGGLTSQGRASAIFTARVAEQLREAMRTVENANQLVDDINTSRSRVRLAALLLGLNNPAMRNSPSFERVAAAAMERLDWLNRDISRAARADVAARADATPINDAVAAFEAIRQFDTVSEALEAVRDRATPAQQQVIDSLLSSGALRGVKLRTDPVAMMATRYYSGEHRGSIDTGESVVTITAPSVRGETTNNPVQTLVHEAVHAATLAAEARNPQLARDLDRLLSHVRERLGPVAANWYGLSDTQEFLAEAFANPQFQELLKGMPAANTRSFANAWEQFKSFVIRVLGLEGDRALSALDEVLSLGAALAADAAVARQSTISRMFGGGHINAFNSQHAYAPSDWTNYLPEDARARLLTAFEAPYIRQKVKEAIGPDMAPLVDAADTGPELLLNVGMAMALDGNLDLGNKDRGIVRQLWDIISEALKIPNANVYAKQIIQDIQSGYAADRGANYDAQRRTLGNDALGKAALSATRWVNKHVVPVTDALLKNMNTRLRERGIPAMREFATLLAQRTGEFRSDRQTSLRQNWETQRSQWLNKFGSIVRGITPQNERILVRALQTGQLPPKHEKTLGKTFAEVSKWFEDFRAYLVEAGVDVGDVENYFNGYFPVVMDREQVTNRREQFYELHRAENLEQPIRDKFKQWYSIRMSRLDPKDNPRDGAEYERLRELRDGVDSRPIDSLIDALYDMAVEGSKDEYVAGVDYTNPQHKPAFTNVKIRTSDFIFKHGTPEQVRQFSKFQSTNLSGIAVSYANRATRRAEWERLDLSERIPALMAKAKEEGATPKDLQLMQDYVNQEMGTYNDDWNPFFKRVLEGVDRVFNTDLASIDFQKFKAVQGALLTYNNVRLLPLALMSSFIDPLATMVRSGSVRGAVSNLRDGFRALRNTYGDDELRKMAETLGIVEREGLGEIQAYLYGNIYDPSSRAARVNNALFKFNGLDSMLRYTRLTALAAGHRFLIRHSQAPTEHSERYLRELGLKASDVKVDPTGRFVELNDATEAALRRFVDESTVRPYPGQKPGWHNDPNFALASQYKGYIYAFYETVLLRAYNELQGGNPHVLVPLLMYLPVTVLAEMARDGLQDDGEEKEFEDYARKGVERSGLLGPRVNVTDEATTNVRYGTGLLGNFAGATGQQIGDMYDVLTGEGSFVNTAVEALPGQALYKNWGD